MLSTEKAKGSTRQRGHGAGTAFYSLPSMTAIHPRREVWVFQRRDWGARSLRIPGFLKTQIDTGWKIVSISIFPTRS